MSDEQGYQGWKNYETWAWKLWVDNEQGSYEDVREITRAIIEETCDYDDDTCAEIVNHDEAIYRLSERLKSESEDAMPDLSGTVWGDLLTAAFQEIDWREIATSLVDEYQEENA